MAETQIDWNLYSDVNPVQVSGGGEDELCAIMYTEEYARLVSVARALMEQDEISPRALDLTGKLIELAPAYYTVWNYRFRIVQALFESTRDVSLLNKDLDFLDELTLGNPKNYQVWSYRQALLGIHPSTRLERELPLLQMMIDDDTKNYHVWSYRKWAVVHFWDFSHELIYTTELINRDVYNNSAWTHRMFYWQHAFKRSAEDHIEEYAVPSHLIEQELQFIREQMEIVPQNISVWTYMRSFHEIFLEGNFGPEIVDLAISFTDGVMDIDSEYPAQIESSYALEFLAYYYGKAPSTTDRARKAYELLANTYDPIRKPMYDHKLRQLK